MKFFAHLAGACSLKILASVMRHGHESHDGRALVSDLLAQPPAPRAPMRRARRSARNSDAPRSCAAFSSSTSRHPLYTCAALPEGADGELRVLSAQPPRYAARTWSLFSSSRAAPESTMRPLSIT